MHQQTGYRHGQSGARGAGDSGASVYEVLKAYRPAPFGYGKHGGEWRAGWLFGTTRGGGGGG